MAESSGFRSDKPSADQDAVAVSEEHPVEFSLWLSQYTYYLDERVKGMVSLKVKDENVIAERVFHLAFKNICSITLPTGETYAAQDVAKERVFQSYQVRVHLRCVGHHIVLTENLTELYRDTQEYVSHGGMAHHRPRRR
jgi:hypothetical protein